MDVLHPVPELDEVTSEKGDSIVANDWPADSVFGLLSALDPGTARPAPAAIAAIFNHPDMLLCTDLGTEISDFVIIEGMRVAFVHAKASKERRFYSASALHDVASQAIKNLHYIQPLEETSPPTTNWTRPWKTQDGRQQTHRLRVGAASSGSEMWSHVRAVTASPSGEREVWLVLGRSLSKKSLEAQARKRKPAPEALQVYSLLQATWGAVSQLGARLRIFCSE